MKLPLYCRSRDRTVQKKITSGTQRGSDTAVVPPERYERYFRLREESPVKLRYYG